MSDIPKTRILIADSDDMRISLATHLFQLQTWAEVVGVAKDGLDVVEKVAKLRPGALILDSNLPLMDGFMALKELRRRGIPVKVVLCSNEDLSDSYARVGADAFFGRADPLGALADLVRDLAHSEMPVPSSTKKYIRSDEGALSYADLWRTATAWLWRENRPLGQ